MNISKVVINHLAESNVLLVNETGKICSFLNLISDDGEPQQYYLEMGKQL